MSNVDVNPQQVAVAIASLVQRGATTWKEIMCMNSNHDPTKVKVLISEVQQTGGKNAERLGKDMEELVHYLLDNCGAFESVIQNKKNKIHEIDHWAIISPAIAPFFASKKITSLHFIGESKNYSAKLDVEKAYKLEGIKYLTNTQFGAFFTRMGLKGDIDRSAKGVLLEYFHKNNHISLIFVAEDWDFLSQHPTKFSELLFEKLNVQGATYDSVEIEYAKV